MQKIFFYKTSGEKVTAIIITPDADPKNKPAAAKYSYIDNSPKGVSTFMAFANRKFPKATHVNFYCKKTGQFMERILLE